LQKLRLALPSWLKLDLGVFGFGHSVYLLRIGTMLWRSIRISRA